MNSRSETRSLFQRNRDRTSQVFSNKAWLFLVLSGLATGLSWLCYFHALQVGLASRVAPIDKLSVALVILFGAIFLGERLTLARGIGGLLIVQDGSPFPGRHLLWDVGVNSRTCNFLRHFGFTAKNLGQLSFICR